MQTTLAALLLPARLKTKLVFGLRAGGMQLRHYDVLNAITYRSEAWLSRRSDLIIANARAVRADAIARGLPADRIAVVPNGIDTDSMQPDATAGRTLRRAWGLSDEAFIIGCVARLDPMKDHANFLNAAARFVREDLDARFVCVGDGPAAYRDELKRLANSLGLADRVLWAGEFGDVKAAYNAFDIATLASAFGEGFPNVVGEAMACGTPVAATDVGDVRSIVGELGEVVPPKNRKRCAPHGGLCSSAWHSIRACAKILAAPLSLTMASRRWCAGARIFLRRTAGRPAQQIAHEFR